jgi:hypothetical protein
VLTARSEIPPRPISFWLGIESAHAPPRTLLYSMTFGAFPDTVAASILGNSRCIAAAKSFSIHHELDGGTGLVNTTANFPFSPLPHSGFRGPARFVAIVRKSSLTRSLHFRQRTPKHGTQQVAHGRL